MDRSELVKLCTRVIGGKGSDGDVAIVALALQRYLVGEGRKVERDRRSYQREYMREYREGKRRRAVKRKGHGKRGKS